MRSTREAEKIAALEAVAEAWNRRGIDYGVCHGLEGYPRGVGRDLDVLVRGAQAGQAARIAAGRLSAMGFLVLAPPKPWGGRWLFGFRRGVQVHVDLIPLLFRGPVLIAAAPEPVLRLGPFQVDPWAGFAKRILMPILGRRPPKGPAPDPREEGAARERCRRIFGEKPTRDLFEFLRGAGAIRLPELAARLRAGSLRRALGLHPWRSLGLLGPWLSRRLRPRLSRCAPIVALVGPDGVGKTATLRALARGVPAPFCGLVARHWRPGLLPRPGSLLGRPAPAPDASGLLVPRRKPGRLHWLRLAYYFLDFTLGHFLRDRPASSGLQAVVYDRHALDMAVDPVRYGLSSARGIRLFCRLIPRPDLVILLHDEPARIRSRKRELELQEIGRQLREWRRLVRAGLVGAVVPAAGGPAQAARAVGELLIEAFLERHGGGDRPEGRRALRRLAAMLAPAACPRDGRRGRRAAAYGRIGLRDGRGYLLPLHPRRAARNALRLYRPQKPAARLLHRLLSAGASLGIGGLVLPRVHLRAPGGGPAARAGGWLLAHLGEVLGRGSLLAGISLGTPGPQRTPVLLLMDGEARPVAFAKIALDAQTRLLVQNEERALNLLGGRRFEHGRVPRVLYFGAPRGAAVLVTEPLELGGNAREAGELQEPHLRFLLELAGGSPPLQRLARSGFWGQLRGRVASLAGLLPASRLQRMEEGLELLERILGGVELPWVWRVGDFVPWNLGLDAREGKLVVVDLEQAAPDCLPGWDLFHFLCRSGTGLPGAPPPGRLPALGEEYFRALGVGRELVPALQAAYLLDLWSMREASWCLSGARPSGSAAALLRVLGDRLFLALRRLRPAGGGG